MYFRKILIGILIVGVIIGFFIMYNITQTIFKPITAFNNEEAYIYIPSDADFRYVRQELTPLLTDSEAFTTLAKKKGYMGRVKGGKYAIRKGMNSNDIVKVLLGKSELVRIAIPENKTPKELAKIISNQIEAKESEVYELLTDTINLEDIKVDNVSFETLLIPGEYTMPWNTSAKEFKTKIISTSLKSSDK